MRTDIEPGPIEHRLNVRRLDGHIGCARRPIERKQAQADAGKYGSAAAVHVDNSSARIPAVSFVMTALLPARCDGRNSSPSLIASHSQLARKNMGNAVEWRRLVTWAQHKPADWVRHLQRENAAPRQSRATSPRIWP